MSKIINPRKILKSAFDAAIIAAQPSKCITKHLPDPPKGRIVVVGAGKGSSSMASALEAHYALIPGAAEKISGLVITRYGHATKCESIEIVEAAHPVPDLTGLNAAKRIMSIVKELEPEDLVIALISGGGSSLLTLPATGVSLDEKQALTKSLLASGATIAEINCVRKHLSAIKGGRLAVACHPAKLHTILISDVPGDNPSVIASGPTIADTSTNTDAIDILNKYRITEFNKIIKLLQQESFETPKPDHPAFIDNKVSLIATPKISLEAAAETVRKHGISCFILADDIEGEARDIGRMHAAIARNIAKNSQPFSKPCVFISGGETTVSLNSNSIGQGGRNVEFLLSLSINLDGCDGIYALAADTDGIDGICEIAGAYVDPQTCTRAVQKGLNISDALANNDGHGFFQALGDSIITGPTYTNVNDFRAILIQ